MTDAELITKYAGMTDLQITQKIASNQALITTTTGEVAALTVKPDKNSHMIAGGKGRYSNRLQAEIDELNRVAALRKA